MTDLKEIMKKEKVIIGTERTIKAIVGFEGKRLTYRDSLN